MRSISSSSVYLKICRISCFVDVSSAITGFWKSRDELKKLQNTDRVFVPKVANKDGAGWQSWEYVHTLQSWERAIRRSMNWYSKS